MHVCIEILYNKDTNLQLPTFYLMILLRMLSCILKILISIGDINFSFPSRQGIRQFFCKAIRLIREKTSLQRIAKLCFEAKINSVLEDLFSPKVKPHEENFIVL